jgi:hypothetical protein
MQQGTKAHFFIPSVRLLHECGEGSKYRRHENVHNMLFRAETMHLVYFVLHNIKSS